MALLRAHGLVLLPALLGLSPLQAADRCAGRWGTAWGSSQMVPEGENALPAGALDDATLRQTIRPSIAGKRIRVRISNLFGTAPLAIGPATIARAAASGSDAIDPASLRPLTFAGRRTAIVPAGAEYLSDPVDLAVRAFEPISVSVHFPYAPRGQTGHPGSRTTSFVARGDATGQAALPGALAIEHWYALSGLEVAGCAPTIVALGDSITDGRGSTTNGDDRWTDRLAARLQADSRTRGIAVVNQGIGGNRILQDGLGPSALARFDRDVLAQAGVRWLILLIGINDLGTLTRNAPVSAAEHQALVQRMTAGYAQIAARARARGIKVIGATVMPFMGTAFYHPDAANEADRQAVNAWIRTSGHFDAVIDFDAVMRDPARPDTLNPAFDEGDKLHPSPAGYRAMGDAVPLSLFGR